MRNIDKIRQEIGRRHAYQKEMYNKTKPDGRPNDGWAESLAIMGELEELRTFLDSLSEEPVLANLEEAAEEFGKRQGVELAPFARKFFKAGAKWQKEQMMRVAVEAEISTKFPVVDRRLISVIDGLKDFKYGDKVHIIVIKEDEK